MICRHESFQDVVCFFFLIVKELPALIPGTCCPANVVQREVHATSTNYELPTIHYGLKQFPPRKEVLFFLLEAWKMLTSGIPLSYMNFDLILACGEEGLCEVLNFSRNMSMHCLCVIPCRQCVLCVCAMCVCVCVPCGVVWVWCGVSCTITRTTATSQWLWTRATSL